MRLGLPGVDSNAINVKATDHTLMIITDQQNSQQNSADSNATDFSKVNLTQQILNELGYIKSLFTPRRIAPPSR